jgi:hypothetical protein
VPYYESMGLFNYESVKKNVYTFIGLQLFISCVTLPLFAWWGLPQSYLAPVGNIVFSPILTLFLLISTLLFFCALIGLPIGLLCSSLEQVTQLWNYLLSWGPCAPFIPGIKPPLLLGLGMPLAAFAIVQYKHGTMLIKIILFSLLLILYYGLLYALYTPQTVITSFPCHIRSVHLIMHKGALTIIDPGALGQRPSGISWCEYTLIPAIIKITGRTTVDHWIMLRPGKIAFEAVTNAAYKVRIKNIYIPWWQNHIPVGAFRSYQTLKRALQKQGCTIHRLFNKELSIGNTGLAARADSAVRRYHEALFPRFEVRGVIDNLPISLYAP